MQLCCLMDKNNEQTRKIISGNKNEIGTKIVHKQYEQNPAYWQQFGSEGENIRIRDADYHISFLTEAIALKDPEIFTDYVDWVRLYFQGHGYSPEFIISGLKSMHEVLKEFLPGDLYQTAAKYLDAGIRKMQEPSKEVHSYIDESAHLGKLARAFNEALLQGSRREASRMILDEVEEGTPIKDIYLHVFQKSQLEVGRLWQENMINVAREHFVSAATQMIMSQLYPYIFSTERNGLSFVGTCIGGELHEIGIRMVCDFFEMEGWDTWYLGANTPTDSLIQSIKENKAEVLGLSVTMPYHISSLQEVVNRIRQDAYGKNVKILVGGNGINHKNYLWKTIGADGFAPDAQKAIEMAGKLVS